MAKIRVVSHGQKRDFVMQEGLQVRDLKAAVQEAFNVGVPRLFVSTQEITDDNMDLRHLDQQLINVSDGQRVMITKPMPDDNSCLFHAIRHSLAPKYTIQSLRNLIALAISERPAYTDVVLGKPRDDYISWIRKSGWGGGIELAIFSATFQSELAVVDVQTDHVDIFGENSHLNQRVYLLYSGIHYDLLELSDGTCRFSPADSDALACALAVANNARNSRQYTNVTSYSLRCDECDLRLKGNKEAQHHAEMFGHSRFSEIN